MPQLGAEGHAMPQVGRDELELVRRAQLGSASAFEQLVLRRGPDLYRYFVLRLRHEADARDALQETLTAAWVGLPRLREPSRFWPWLVGIAAHKAADSGRRRTREHSIPFEVESTGDEAVVELKEALDALPERSRQVLLLRYVLDLSEDEVAHVLGVRLGTVKSRTARARRALEERLR
jgi:RNA polymerase sigma factor (sigma-70 family)